ncbi:heme biosynthesis protein HemY [Methylobacterium oxalidis]|uniref:Membrane protein n=1 Tax=Methylobacterium oxalidis TaxID=944322 RepID=A0A512J501_9HYPH|nr:heme biosynthesis HemY N-terminal domain-containing protein [Methylobacterium oxalidis]GEP05000.1 membrane protein [Methylobacterium oxalidis]GJE35663.1 Lipopolysaccharide assembly protein B [Methylobacterium oxalidis]GLS63738.1 membrane protein [Methylobacterium oxalidis]
MWRALAFLALLALAAFGAVWIADRPGTVTIVWNGYEVATSLAIALVGVLVAALVIGFIWAIVRGVIGLPGSLVRGSRERRRAKGFTALSRGMVAVGSGDPLAARRHAGDAERLLGAEPLALLLKAQAAQISGDREAAEQAFQRMANDPETRVLGLRGLFVEARRREDETAARAYAAEAARLAPSVTWANEAMLEAQCADGDWAGALETVERRASLGLIEKASARRQRAVLLTASAQAREAGEPEIATERALKAVKLAPDLVPAAAIAGRLLSRTGDLRKAAKIVEAAWKANPHPDLAKVYLNLRTGDSVRDRLARAETLAKLSTWHPEARLALAQTAYEAREFGQAREALQPLLADRPTVRACLMMARIEEAEHGAGSGRAREWLARAAHAPRDPLWIADGVASETWAPISPVSGRLDAFEWKAPTELLAGPDSGEGVTGDLDDRGESRPIAPIAPAGASRTGDQPKPVPAQPVSAQPGSAKPDVAKPAAAPAEAGKPAAQAPVTPTSLPQKPETAAPLAAGTATPVVLPLPRTPDDPGAGPEEAEAKARRFG